MRDNDYIFRSMPVRSAILTLAIPTVISQIITLIYNIADTFFIGQLNDAKQVAAVTVSMPIFVALTALSNLFGIGCAAKIARCLGVGDRDGARRASAFSIYTAAAVSLVYGIVILAVSRTFLPILGAKPDTLEYCISYVTWTVAVGALPTVMSATLAHLVRAEGYAKEAGFGVGLGGVLNIILDPIFIFALDLEISGAAIATMLSNFIALGYFVLLLYKIRKNTVITALPKCFTIKREVTSDVLLGGLPSFLMMMMGCLSNSVLNRLVTSYSTEAMAGMGIAKKIDMVAFAVSQGMTQGILPLVAYNYAAKNSERMKATIKTTLTYTLAFAFCAMTVLLLFAGPITRCFIDDDITVAYGRDFLRILCLICPSTAVNHMAITVFQATKRRLPSVILSFLRKGSLDIPLMLGMSGILGVTGVAWATPISDWMTLVIAAVMVIFMQRGRKNAEKITESH